MRDVIVTGGSGALGREVVAAFLRRGDRVVVPWIVERERDELSTLYAGALAEERLVLIAADVGSDEGATKIADLAPELEAVVNGVGGFAGGTAVEETDLEVWDRMYHLNVRTAVAMSRAALPLLRRRGNGALLFVAAQPAFDAPPGIAAYAASKSALVTLVRSLQKELAGTNLRVNAVVPTTIDTPANRRAMPDADPSSWTQPSEIARVLVWLASEEARTVRGALVPV
jgi:NAD(P)-dependent dehydrogenase (short-subunit alcohol dehydrogenase family)